MNFLIPLKMCFLIFYLSERREGRKEQMKGKSEFKTKQFIFKSLRFFSIVLTYVQLFKLFLQYMSSSESSLCYKDTLTDASLFYFPESAVSEVGSDTSIIRAELIGNNMPS